MTFRETEILLNMEAATAQTLPVPVARVIAIDSFGALGVAADTLTNIVVTTSAPPAGEIQFTGTAQSPSAALTLGTAAVAGQALRVRAVLPGEAAAYL